MCGRFTNRYSWRELYDLYRLTVANNAPHLPLRYNIAPTQSVLVTRATGQGRELAMLRWGGRAVTLALERLNTDEGLKMVAAALVPQEPAAAAPAPC